MATLFEQDVNKDSLVAWAKKVAKNEPTYETDVWDAKKRTYVTLAKKNSPQCVLALTARWLTFMSNEEDRAYELNDELCDVLLNGCVGFANMKVGELVEYIIECLEVYSHETIGDFAEFIGDLWKVVAV